MRLHQLEATAFGPFADTVRVDFDALSQSGLFLLSGPTGAGKTSVLDAVCFALYGEVPGDRGAAKRLRADQAPPELGCRVVLELTFAGRRLRIDRSPAWERPKKRGTGTTTQPAKVVVAELVAGEWTTLTTRLDEAGQLVSSLIGMTHRQFVQVAMLPQGRFGEFLRSRADERQRLLQQLFRTERFGATEKWLRERRLTVRRSSETHHGAVSDLLGRACEVAECGLPDTVDADDLWAAASSGHLHAWVVGLAGATEQQAAQSRAHEPQFAADEHAARERLEAGRETARRHDRIRDALAEQQRLAEQADAQAAAAQRLAAARRAVAVAPLHAAAVAAATERTEAHATHRDLATQLRAALPDCPHGVADDPAALQRLNADLAASATRLRDAVPQQQRMAEVESSVVAAEQRLAELAREAESLTTARSVLPGRLERLRARGRAADQAARDVIRLQHEHDVLAGRLEVLDRIQALAPELADARAELATATASLTRARVAWLDLREARLEGMAAELAGGLAVGACCPVCGSSEHPDKASPLPGAPDAEGERTARTAVDDAAAVEHAHADRVRELETRLTVLREQAGTSDHHELRVQHERIGRELTDRQAVANGADELAERIERLETQSESLAEQLRRVSGERAECEAGLAALGAERDRLSTDLTCLLGREAGPATDLEQRAAQHERASDLAGRCREAVLRCTEADERQQLARAALEEAAAESGFESAHEAIGAVLDGGELDALADLVAEHERRSVEVATVLAELGPHDDEQPDLEQLRHDHEAALAALSEARAATRDLVRRGQRLRELAEQVKHAVARWRPVMEDLEVTSGLASFVEGKSPDNRLQMRLSAYVLAYRLAQVVAAANERLERMSDRRYSLEHTAQRGAGDPRGGLGLLVRDDWSGESRDPATLSGGETFVVSLALALGLADVITHESDAAAEGSPLETLFVDEGFGALDPDTLDDVMDTLDSLRDGGRVVGVVSHVAEMRDRIPVQLRVSKSPRGSTIAAPG